MPAQACCGETSVELAQLERALCYTSQGVYSNVKESKEKKEKKNQVKLMITLGIYTTRS